MAELTAKQARFVEEYLVDLNATQAAIRAGYSEKTAYSVGHENLSKPDIAEAIAQAKSERSQRTQITADRVLQELGRIGFSDIRNVLTPLGHLTNPADWDDDTAAAIGSIEVVTKPGEADEEGNRTVDHVHKIKTWDKVSALEKIAKHLGMFVERHEVTGKDGGPLETKDVTPYERARRIAHALAQDGKSA